MKLHKIETNGLIFNGEDRKRLSIRVDMTEIEFREKVGSLIKEITDVINSKNAEVKP
jgi:hypothetical protein